MVEISERSFEKTIECGLLRYGPDACAGEIDRVREAAPPYGNLRVLARHLLRAARRVFGIPDFQLYALADGIKHFLFNRSKGLRIDLPPPKPRFVQRLLFDPKKFWGNSSSEI